MGRERGGVAPRACRDRKRVSQRMARIWNPEAQMVSLRATDWEQSPQGQISLGHALMEAGIMEMGSALGEE
eukprot:1524121-Karenia_brevis.AAC.1